jgi:hypothetical protein
MVWSSGSTAPDIQVQRAGVGILRFSNPISGTSSGDFSTQFLPAASTGGTGDNVITLFRGTTQSEYLRFGAASGGGLLAGANNIYYIDRVSTSTASARSIQFRRSMDAGATFVNDLWLDPNGNMTIGGNSGNFTMSPTAGNATIYMNPASGYASGVVWATGGVNNWQFYQLASDPHLYFRDLVNARMQMTFTPGTTPANSSTNINSQLTVDGPFVLGGGTGDSDPNVYMNALAGQTNWIWFQQAGVAKWLLQVNPSGFIVSDQANSRSHMILTPGASIAASYAEFNSNIQADGYLSVGGAPSLGSGSGPLLYLANDTADPSGSVTGGALVFSSGGVLKAKTPDGTVTQIAPVPWYKFTYVQTLSAPTIASSPYTVTHNLGSTNVFVQLWDAITQQIVMAQVKIQDANTVLVSFAANAPNNINVMVFGVPNAPVPIQATDTVSKAYVDARTPNLPAPVTSGSGVQSFTDTLGDVWVAANGVYGGAWKRARDVVRARIWRTTNFTPVGSAWTIFPFDTVTDDAYGLCTTGASANFAAPVAGRYMVSSAYNIQIPASGTFRATLDVYKGTTPVARGADNQITNGTTVNQFGPTAFGTVPILAGDVGTATAQISCRYYTTITTANPFGIVASDLCYMEVQYIGTT